MRSEDTTSVLLRPTFLDMMIFLQMDRSKVGHKSVLMKAKSNPFRFLMRSRPLEKMNHADSNDSPLAAAAAAAAAATDHRRHKRRNWT